MKNYIPTIDVSSIIKNNFDNAKSFKVIKEIEKACIEVGFFQITHHGIPLNVIKNVCAIGEKFFNSPKENKIKLAPKKWNKKNKNVYRGYFPNDVNGKEGLDIGDLLITKQYSNKVKKQYIEYLNLDKSFNKKTINDLRDYFDRMFLLSEKLFQSIIKLYKKDIKISKIAFERLKTLSTLRYNYYPNQTKPSPKLIRFTLVPSLFIV